MADLKMITDRPSFKGVGHSDADAFNHRVIADSILEILEKNDPPMTIGLFGGWGVGKSSIMNLIESLLDRDKYAYVYFNAWKYSGDSFRREFLLTVARSEEIIKSKSERESKVNELSTLSHTSILKKPKETISISKSGVIQSSAFIVLATIATYLLISGGEVKSLPTMGSGIFALVVSLVVLFLNQVKQIIKVDVDNSQDPKLIFPEQFVEKFKELVNIASKNKPSRKLVFVIDDLDRCEIDMINSVLVSLKNFFEVDRCCFIVPMDDSSVVQMFSAKNTNIGYEQLRKYFSVSIRIPVFHNEDIVLFAKETAKKYNISQNVAYLAAKGYCKDARKMKHFLNLFMIKRAIAVARHTQGYLGELDVSKLEPQIAKLTVLEYQYPEFYRVITENPEYLNRFTNAARGHEENLSESEILCEFSESKDGKISINDVWKKYRGLRKFLAETYQIEIIDLDTLAKLKTTEQVTRLGSIGSKLSRAVTENEFHFEEFLTADSVQGKDEAIVDTLQASIDDDLELVTRRVIEIAHYLLINKMLIAEEHKRLFIDVTRVITSKTLDFKLQIEDLSFYLNESPQLSESLHDDILSKVQSTLLSQDSYTDAVWEVINHPEFFSRARNDSNQFNTSLERWLQEVFDNPVRLLSFLKGLNSLRLTKGERKNAGLVVPSAVLEHQLVSRISGDDTEMLNQINDELYKLFLNPNNAGEFTSDDTLDSTLVRILKDLLSRNAETEGFTRCADFVLRLPRELHSDQALKLSRFLTNQPIEEEEEVSSEPVIVENTPLVLCLLLRCLPRLSETQSKSEIEFVEGVYSCSSTELQAVIDLINSYSYLQNEYTCKLLNQGVTKKWQWVKDNFQTLHKETDLLPFARICQSYLGNIDIEVKSFVQQLLSLSEVEQLQHATNYIVEKAREFGEPFIIECITAVTSNISNQELPIDCRTIYIDLYNALLNLIPSERRGNTFDELVATIQIDDFDLLPIFTEKFEPLRSTVGRGLLQPQQRIFLEAIVNDETNDLSQYSTFFNTCLLNGKLSPESSTTLARRIMNELPLSEKSEGHRMLLLELTNEITAMSDDKKDDLSQTLYYYKDTGDNPQLRGKAHEINEMLISNGTIRRYSPPPPPPPSEATTEEA